MSDTYKDNDPVALKEEIMGTAKVHPTYAERRMRLIQQIIQGYSGPYALALAEVICLGDLLPQDETQYEGLAASLCYLRLMRGKAEGAISHAEGLKEETLANWHSQIRAARQARIDSYRKHNSDYAPHPGTGTKEEIRKLAAELLTAQEVEDKARGAKYRAEFELIRAIGGTI